MNNRLKAGVAEVCITPKRRISIAGYFDDRISEGILDDIYVKSIVFDDGAQKFALISADIIAIPNDVFSRIRKIINLKTGILQKNIFISATHTHTAPALGELFRVKPSKFYIEFFMGKVLQAVCNASKNMKEISVGVGIGKSPKVAFNRRYLMKNGNVVTNPPYSSDILRPAGPVDDEIGVIKLTGADKKTFALIINCTNHVDTIGGNLISADWPGFLSREVKNKLGKNVVVMILNGAAGDINHFDILNNRTICNYDESRRIGKEYAKAVFNVLKGRIEEIICKNIKTKSTILRIPLRKIAAEQVERAKRIIVMVKNRPKIKKILESVDLAKGSIEAEARFAEELLKLRKEGKIAITEISIFKIGNLVIVGIPGEPFTEIGLRIKSKSKFKYTFISELSNGYIGYIPTKEAFSGGGYETKIARSSKLVPGAANKIIKTVLKMLNRP